MNILRPIFLFLDIQIVNFSLLHCCNIFLCTVWEFLEDINPEVDYLDIFNFTRYLQIAKQSNWTNLYSHQSPKGISMAQISSGPGTKYLLEVIRGVLWCIGGILRAMPREEAYLWNFAQGVASGKFQYSPEFLPSQRSLRDSEELHFPMQSDRQVITGAISGCRSPISRAWGNGNSYLNLWSGYYTW